MQEQYVKINNLKVSEKLARFVQEELLKDTEITTEKFWLGFEKSLHELVPKNRELIKIREDLQKELMIGILKIKEKNLV